jgi:hypothetical protein
MNNSFPRLIDGMCATLRQEVLTRLDDEFARGQVFGVINLLNTFKVRADWSAGFLLQQLAAQRNAFESITESVGTRAPTPALPTLPIGNLLATSTINELLTLRDEGNRAISGLLVWLDAVREQLPTASANNIEMQLLASMRAEVDIELKNAPRPLFAEMSSGQETPG